VAASFHRWLDELAPLLSKLSNSDGEHPGHKLCLKLTTRGYEYHVSIDSLSSKEAAELLRICREFPGLVTPY
jgi:hypothetical protein